MINYRKRSWLVLVVIFVAVASFTFLMQKFKDNNGAQAANPWAFDPGYIISDWQMGNYNSMSEAEIQAFLTRMNPCNNRDYGEYLNQTNAYGSKGYSWHWDNDHFVCLSQERFGDGMTIGSGDTAAHIIWQTAQDYRINPQVLIVLLEKENGLVTDTFPHNNQYRTATGFGCPDTAACDSQYFGFKNQLRQAAALFRTVLDGGWSNYPVGNNYVQYNPNAACGGTIVNIRNRATSALYRYTPYQPNASALGAGYGLGDGCGAYGNRNFYLYFEDWFGGITREGATYVPMDEPRYMITVGDVDRIKSNGTFFDTLESGRMLKFVSKTSVGNGEACLRTEFGTNYNEDACVRMSDLKDVELNPQNVTNENTQKIIEAGAQKIRIRGEEVSGTFSDEMVREMPQKVEFNGVTYYVTDYDKMFSGSEYGFRSDDVRDAPYYYNIDSVKSVWFGANNANRIDPEENKFVDTLYKGNTYSFASYTMKSNKKYYRTEHNTIYNLFLGISEEDLEQAIFVDFEEPRVFTVAENTNRINPITGEIIDTIEKGRKIKFVTKVLINNEWYYRTEQNSQFHEFMVIPSSDLIDKR